MTEEKRTPPAPVAPRPLWCRMCALDLFPGHGHVASGDKRINESTIRWAR